MATIALLTDFGTDDWFVGTMKGVILSIHPSARLVDITHGIPPGDVRAGAFALHACRPYFPRGTIFLCVVDPGVGGSRQTLAARAGGFTFVAPDNGLLSFALRGLGRAAFRALENPAYRPVRVSRTFHGRDIFAPAAAHLGRGAAFASLGRRLKEMRILDWPEPRPGEGMLQGEVIYIDRFGNAITNLPAGTAAQSARRVPEAGTAPVVVEAGRRRLPWKQAYAEAAEGEALALAGSSDLVEIAVNRGHAARKLGLKVGDRVVLRLPPS